MRSYSEVIAPRAHNVAYEVSSLPHASLYFYTSLFSLIRNVKRNEPETSEADKHVAVLG